MPCPCCTVSANTPSFRTVDQEYVSGWVVDEREVPETHGERGMMEYRTEIAQ